VSDAELAAVLTEQEPEQAVQTLADMANEQGGPDNITAVIAHVLGLPARLAGDGPDIDRPEILAAKTTQPVRLDREQIDAAASAESADADQEDSPQAPASTARRRRIGQLLHVPLSPRRRRALLVTAIVLVVLLAIAALIAFHVIRMGDRLAWAKPVFQALPAMLGAQVRCKNRSY
jgi:hypothetical protein